MELTAALKKHKIASLLFALMTMFFLVAGLISTAAYVNVVSAQSRIEIDQAAVDIQTLPDDTVRIQFDAHLTNPSKYDLQLSTVTWKVSVYNYSAYPVSIIVVASDYVGASQAISIAPGGEADFSYDVTVDDAETLSRLDGYINQKSLEGVDYDLGNLPYVTQLTVTGWLGDFQHDYLREDYLNDLVRVELEYSDVWGS